MPEQSLNLFANELEGILAKFETDWHDGLVPLIEDVLPDESHPEFSSIVLEVVRSDIEFRWQSGKPETIENYLVRFPCLVNAEYLKKIAFEEYRAKSQNGIPADSKSYRENYQVDVSEWKNLNPFNGSNSQREQREAAIEKISRLQTGETVGEFEIVQRLGRGASGSVFIAKQAKLLDRLVVVKISPKTSEPEILAQLQHTNIVPIYSFARTNDYQIFCMPLLGLITLQDVLENPEVDCSGPPQQLINTVATTRAPTLSKSLNGPSCNDNQLDEMVAPGVHLIPRLTAMVGTSSVEVWAWFFLRIAHGLKHAHQNEIIHRDLKPENILIADNGEPLILDFHLSTSAAVAGVQYVGGTLPYMSPEQLRSLSDDSLVGFSSDIYSFGVIFYQTISGCLPFASRKGPLTQVVEQMLEDRRSAPPLLTTVAPEAGYSLSSIVNKCLGYLPGDRYQDMEELIEDLNRLRERRPLVHAPNLSLRERFQNWMFRHPKISSATTIGVFALLIVLFVSLGFWQRGIRIAKLAAMEQSRHMISEFENAIPNLALPIQDYEQGYTDFKIADAFLVQWNATTLSAFQNSDMFQLLSDEQQKASSQAVEHLQFWISDSARRLAAFVESDDRKSVLNRSEFESATIEPTEFLASFLRAAELYQAREFQMALDILETLCQTHSDRAFVWVLKGNVLHGLGRLEESKACFSVCIGLAPDPSWAFAQRGLINAELKNHKESISDFSSAIELSPSTAPYYLNRGLSNYFLKDFVSAKQDFDKAIELGTSETRVYFLRSRVLTALGSRAEAIADYENGLRLEPADELSYIARGVALIQQNPNFAAEDFKQAVQMNSQSKIGLQNLAHVYSERLNDLSSAIRWMERLVEIDPRDAGNVATLGVLQARADLSELATESANRALRLNNNAQTMYQAAGIFALLAEIQPNNKTVAIDLLKNAAAKEPKMVWDEMSLDPDLAKITDSQEFLEFKQQLQNLLGDEIQK